MYAIRSYYVKRRRGSGNAIKIRINFLGKPKITFVLDTEEKQWYDNAVEKIDFVLELLPYHIDPEKLPPDVSELTYRFDSKAVRITSYNVCYTKLLRIFICIITPVVKKIFSKSRFLYKF